MIECSEALVDFLLYQDLMVWLDVKPTGCSGYSINSRIYTPGTGVPGVWIEYDYFIMVSDALHKKLDTVNLYVDYLDEPLMKGVHISIKKAANVCGCGESFN